MKVGDEVKWIEGGWGDVTVSAVSDDGAFVNILPRRGDEGWWPSKCFEGVKPAEPEPPKYVEIEISGPFNSERFRLVPGERFVIRLDLTSAAETT